MNKFILCLVALVLATINSIVLCFVNAPKWILVIVLLFFFLSIIAGYMASTVLKDTNRVFSGCPYSLNYLMFAANVLFNYIFIYKDADSYQILIVGYLLALVLHCLSFRKFFILFKAIESKSYFACPGIVTDADEDITAIRHRNHQREVGRPFLMIAETNSLNGSINRTPEPLSHGMKFDKVDGVPSVKFFVERIRYDLYDKGDAGYLIKIDDDRLDYMITFL